MIQEEIKTRLKSGNTCYHSVQNLLSSSLLSKNIKHNDELNDLYFSQNVYSGDQMKTIEMGGVCSAYGGRGEGHTGVWWENQKERDHVEEPDIFGKMILKWIFRKWNGVH